MKNVSTQVRLLRTDFTAGSIPDKSLSKNPLKMFSTWMKDAIDAKTPEPNAMTLATSGESGPDARIVLLRGFDSKGFSFFTNYNSIKGREIRYNKRACLNFFWAEVHRQVRIKGTVTKLSVKESEGYFKSRPRDSQLAAWASEQSGRLTSRKELDDRFLLYKKKFMGMKVPKPPHWGGYILKPDYIEFWQGRSNRLHDRLVYVKKKSNWIIQRLNP